ncbi:MAG: DUF2306 domain-containing protein [Acidimicrobiia bacterium]|nr:DUF2306 domain-containing protein [Acidimicrobiia bacterium]MDH5520949.1 DUF2306 domain-containing protein [Acidimicrobiia bacterium]
MNNVDGRQWAWLGLIMICLAYGGFALVSGVVEFVALVGGPDPVGAKVRAVPPVFVVHALTGGTALAVGAVQFNGRLLRASPAFHRWAGRTYVACIWITSVAALWSAVFFDVPIGGRVALAVLAAHWFAATTIAYRMVRRRRIAEHRRWMIRSFALSLFFVTFPLWTAAAAASPLPEQVGYPLAVVAAWGLNVVLAEIWIARYPTVASPPAGPPASRLAGPPASRPADCGDEPTPGPAPASLGAG